MQVHSKFPESQCLCHLFIADISDTERRSIRGAAVIVILLAIFHICIEGYQFWSLKHYYFLEVANWIEMFLFIFSIIFVWVFHTDCLCPQKWQWQIGAIVVFFGWIDLILLVRRLPFTQTGLYIVMFTDIFITALKLIIFAFMLVLALSLALYMVFHEPQFTVSTGLWSAYTT